MRRFEALEVRTLLHGCPCQFHTGDWIPRIAEDGQADDLVIEAGQIVELTGDLDFNEIRVAHEGELRLNNVHLSVETILVEHHATLRIGPVAEIVFKDGSFDLSKDPEEMAFGLISLGTVDIHGQEKSTFERLAAAPRSGDTQFTFAEPVTGWKAGDELAIADTRSVSWAEIKKALRVGDWTYHMERPIVQSVSADGRTVTLAAPLAYDHPGSADGQHLPHVANLSRSIVFRSENPDGMRGHFLSHGAADIAFAEFADMGRTTVANTDNNRVDASGTVTYDGTNQLGRYSLHLHHAEQPQVIGNSIHDGLRWGITIHGTHDGYFSQNVMWGLDGSGMMLEDGTERGNLIEENFAGANLTGRGGPIYGKDGLQGNGFWFENTSNDFINNVAANSHFGFGTFPKNNEQTGLFIGNEYYGIGDAGKQQAAAGFTRLGLGGGDDPSAGSFVIDGFTAWNYSFMGILMHAAMDNTEIRNVQLNSPVASGIKYFRIAKNARVTNPAIQTGGVGIEVPTVVAERGTLQMRDFVIEGGKLKNRIDVWIGFAQDNSDRSATAPRRVLINGTDLQGATKVHLQNFRTTKNGGVVDTNVFNPQENIWITPSGERLDLYFSKQSPDAVVPHISARSSKVAPEAGLTNTQLQAKYGLAVAGAIAGGAVCLDTIDGLAIPAGGRLGLVLGQPLLGIGQVVACAALPNPVIVDPEPVDDLDSVDTISGTMDPILEEQDPILEDLDPTVPDPDPENPGLEELPQQGEESEAVEPAGDLSDLDYGQLAVALESVLAEEGLPLDTWRLSQEQLAAVLDAVLAADGRS